MKTTSAALLVFALVLITGCVEDDRDEEFDVEGLEAEIEATNARFESFVSAQQWDSVAALYTDDAIMMPQGAPMQRGPSAIRDGFEQMGQQGGITNVRLETMDVEASGDLAYEVGEYTLQGQGGAQIDRGKYLVVWKRDGDTWKLHRDMFNSDAATTGPGSPADTTTLQPGDQGAVTPGQATGVPGDTVGVLEDTTAQP